MARPPQRAVYSLSCLAVGGVLSLLCKARLYGRTNLPPRGPLILASNHQSFLDPPLVGALAGRPLHYMARESLFRIPGLATLIRILNAFPVKSGGTDLSSFETSMRILKSGGALLMFPEGTRCRDGRVAPCRSGVIHLSRRANAPILPVAIEGAFDAWPKSARLPKPSPISVQFGRLICPTRFADLNTRQAANLLTHNLRELHTHLSKRAGKPTIGYAAVDGFSGGRDRDAAKPDNSHPMPASQPTPAARIEGASYDRPDS